MVQLETAEVSDERVTVGNGVSIPRSWTAVVHDEPGVPGTVRIAVGFNAQLGRCAASAVLVESAGGEDEVTSLTLREVRVQAVVQATGLKLATVVSDEAGDPESGVQYLLRMREWPDRTTGEAVLHAATTYRLAAAISLPPLKAVSDNLGVSQSTATRLMNRARMDGLASFPRAPEPDYAAPVVGPTTSRGPSI
ncbi:hypothetical protein [Microbacterium sp. CJ88]|uniref:hypothetical protein n=1 Tax=Microbacterium sp. CJ88 TaxID=3445672 RepID=UPI003F65F690